MKVPPSLKLVDLSKADLTSYDALLADCIILTHDNRLLMQQRPLKWGSAAGCLTSFGGHVEKGETIVQGLVRELGEELGAKVDPKDLVLIGGLTEEWTKHQELVGVYFWHDKHGTITGCYEGEAAHYNSVAEALAHPKIMDYARWAVEEAQERGLLKNVGLPPSPPAAKSRPAGMP